MAAPLLLVVCAAVHRTAARQCPRARSTLVSASQAASFPLEVLRWLDAERVPWRRLELEHATGPVVALGAEAGSSWSLALHLLASPRSAAEVAPAWANARLTDVCARLPDAPTIVHLHEDVWTARGEIARARLLARLGRAGSRLFARNTVAARIDAAACLQFLERNHLWGGTRAKYYYGLTDKAGRLVAVATFSHARRVTRAGVQHRSHELLRTCAARDGSVVGGISKLVAAFCKAHGADDVVTVVDRDWGGAAGWRSLGFEQVQLMPPLPMVVGADGVRRHLIGAGLVHAAAPAAGAGPSPASAALLRAALPDAVAHGLATHAAAQPLAWLEAHGLYPLHDAGVARLLLLVAPPAGGEGGGAGGSAARARALWEASQPSYAPEHYSPNPGVAALLRAARADTPAPAEAATADVPAPAEVAAARAPTPPDDAPEVGADLASWRAACSAAEPGASSAGRLVLALPSTAGDGGARVEVRARADGWRALRVVSGPRHILQAVVRLDGAGAAEPRAVASEYLRTMAALALAALEEPAGAAMPMGAGASEAMAGGGGAGPRGAAGALRCLHLGLGAGVLPRLLAAHEPASTHLAIEIDGAVVAAIAQCGGLRLPGGGSGAEAGPGSIRVELRDAAEWVAEAACLPPGRLPQFDAIFIDCFDNENACPPCLLSAAFLEQLARLLSPRGLVLHNLHFGAKRLVPALAAAEAAYARAFASAVRVDSLDSKPWAGNALLCGAARAGALVPAADLEARAARVQRRLSSGSVQRAGGSAYASRSCGYDMAARVRGARPLLPLAERSVAAAPAKSGLSSATVGIS